MPPHFLLLYSCKTMGGLKQHSKTKHSNMSESSFVHDEAVDSDVVPPNHLNGHLDVSQTGSNRSPKVETESHWSDSDHSGEDDKKFSCIQCDYNSKTRSTLLCHVKRVHLGIKDQKCPKCPYTAGIFLSFTLPISELPYQK